VDVVQLNESIPIQLRKIIENDSGIKPLLLDIESLILKQCKEDRLNLTTGE
jgi:hypothetical protein